jgi:hypothetical protein
MEIKKISKEDFNTSSGIVGIKSSWKAEFIQDLSQTIEDNKGNCIEIPIEENLKFYIGNSKNPSKALNVLCRTFLENPNKKVKINRNSNSIKIDLS